MTNFRIIDFFDYGKILQTLIFTLGFLSLVNIVVSISVGTFNNLEQEEEDLQTLLAGRQTKTLKVAFYKIAEVK